MTGARNDPGRRALWRLTIASALVAALAAYFVDARYGSTRYHLGGAAHDIPHRYGFARQAQLPGSGRGPAEDLLLLLPAREVAAGVAGYSPSYRGHVGPVDADLVATVIDDAGARRFAQLHARQWANFDARLSEDVSRRLEPTGGDRLVFNESPPEQGRRGFYLVPSGDIARPPDRTPPYCLASPDVQGRERYRCSYAIHRDGLTFDFTLAGENIGTADRIPDHIRARLSEWRR